MNLYHTTIMSPCKPRASNKFLALHCIRRTSFKYSRLYFVLCASRDPGPASNPIWAQTRAGRIQRGYALLGPIAPARRCASFATANHLRFCTLQNFGLAFLYRIRCVSLQDQIALCSIRNGHSFPSLNWEQSYVAMVCRFRVIILHTAQNFLRRL